MPLKHQRRAFDALGCRNQLFAGGIEAQAFGQTVEQCWSAERGLEGREAPADRRLAQP